MFKDLLNKFLFIVYFCLDIIVPFLIIIALNSTIFEELFETYFNDGAIAITGFAWILTVVVIAVTKSESYTKNNLMALVQIVMIVISFVFCVIGVDDFWMALNVFALLEVGTYSLVYGLMFFMIPKIDKSTKMNIIFWLIIFIFGGGLIFWGANLIRVSYVFYKISEEAFVLTWLAALLSLMLNKTYDYYCYIKGESNEEGVIVFLKNKLTK